MGSVLATVTDDATFNRTMGIVAQELGKTQDDNKYGFQTSRLAERHSSTSTTAPGLGCRSAAGRRIIPDKSLASTTTPTALCRTSRRCRAARGGMALHTYRAGSPVAGTTGRRTTRLRLCVSGQLTLVTLTITGGQVSFTNCPVTHK